MWINIFVTAQLQSAGLFISRRNHLFVYWLMYSRTYIEDKLFLFSSAHSWDTHLSWGIDFGSLEQKQQNYDNISKGWFFASKYE